MSLYLCSIIIATRNEEKYIESCIESLKSQTINREQYEIIIVDGLSEDNSVNIIKRLQYKYDNIKLFTNKKIIASSAFNIGIKNSNAPYIMIVGAHAEYPSDFIEKNLKSIKENGVDCVGGKIIMKGRNPISDTFAVVRNTAFGGGLSPYRYSNTKQLVDTVAFGCYKKEFLLEVGGYDESLVRNQDNDINKRIVKAGGKILFDPDIKFYYYTRDSIKEMWKQMYNYGYWEAVLVKNRKDQLSIFTLVPMIFVLYTFTAIFLGIIFGSSLPFLVEFIPYTLVFTFFTFKYIIPKRKNILIALVLYLLIHFSIGIGFISGLLKLKKGD